MIAGAEQVARVRAATEAYLSALAEIDGLATRRLEGDALVMAAATNAMQAVAQVIAGANRERVPAVLMGLGRGYGVALAVIAFDSSAIRAGVQLFVDGIEDGVDGYRNAMTPGGRA